MAAATKTMKLSNDQQKAVIEMYNAGVTKYTEIQKKLKLPYIAINKFMTKWKAQHGVLKTRHESAKAETLTRSETVLDVGDIKIPARISQSEYLMYKNFYLEARVKELEGKQKH